MSPARLPISPLRHVSARVRLGRHQWFAALAALLTQPVPTGSDIEDPHNSRTGASGAAMGAVPEAPRGSGIHLALACFPIRTSSLAPFCKRPELLFKAAEHAVGKPGQTSCTPRRGPPGASRPDEAPAPLAYWPRPQPCRRRLSRRDHCTLIFNGGLIHRVNPCELAGTGRSWLARVRSHGSERRWSCVCHVCCRCWLS